MTNILVNFVTIIFYYIHTSYSELIIASFLLRNYAVSASFSDKRASSRVLD
jgi:hypothetical protein